MPGLNTEYSSRNFTAAIKYVHSFSRSQTPLWIDRLAVATGDPITSHKLYKSRK